MATNSDADSVLQLLQNGVEIYDLSQKFYSGLPVHPNTAGFRMMLSTRHGDSVTETGRSAAHETIVMGTHVGTHIDALAHISQDGKLYGGLDAQETQTGGRFSALGADEIAPMICRGVLLDVAGWKSVDQLDGDTEIQPEDLQQTAAWAGVELRKGDVVLIRTGWASNFGDTDRFLGLQTGVPGPNEAAAQWLLDQGMIATGAETLSYEYLKPALGTNGGLPVHRLLLVESGIPIVEVMDLQPLADAQVYEFGLVLAPLNFVGASGAACRPLAFTGAK